VLPEHEADGAPAQPGDLGVVGYCEREPSMRPQGGKQLPAGAPSGRFMSDALSRRVRHPPSYRSPHPRASSPALREVKRHALAVGTEMPCAPPASPARPARPRFREGRSTVASLPAAAPTAICSDTADRRRSRAGRESSRSLVPSPDWRGPRDSRPSRTEAPRRRRRSPEVSRRLNDRAENSHQPTKRSKTNWSAGFGGSI
jgi:hypothetical protein